ncbi:MAG: hypothetical protein AAFQ81_13375 [Pseudomonadota bacterium]
MMRLIAPALHLGLLFAAFSWPLLYNGAPLLFWDSEVYLRGGEAALEQTLGLENPNAAAAPEQPAEPPTTPPQTATPETAPAATTPPADASPSAAERTMFEGSENFDDSSVSLARSVYWSVLFTLSIWLGGATLPALVQAALFAGAIYLTIRALFHGKLTGPVLAFLPLAFVTPAAIIAVLLLPDVLAPLAILATAVLVTLGCRVPLAAQLAWTALLVASVGSHVTHLFVTLALLPTAAVVSLLLGQRPSLRGMALVSCALIAGFASIAAFKVAVEQKFGYEPVSLPMIAASVLADGTGTAYLREVCPQDSAPAEASGRDWVYCPWRDREFSGTDAFLWATDPDVGVYYFVDAEKQRQFSKEQISFAFAVLAYDPVGQLSAWTRRYLLQLRLVGAEDFVVLPRGMPGFTARLGAADQSRFEKSAVEEGRMPLPALSWLSYISAGIAALALPLLIVALLRRPRAGPASAVVDAGPRLVAAFALVLVAGLLLNAAATGLPSQPQDRYQARVAVLLPLAAIACLLWLFRHPLPPMRASAENESYS